MSQKINYNLMFLNRYLDLTSVVIESRREDFSPLFDLYIIPVSSVLDIGLEMQRKTILIKIVNPKSKIVLRLT